MSPQAWLLAGTVITSVGLVVAAWIGQRVSGKKAKTDLGQQIIDQLQEERKADEEKHQREVAALDGRHRREMAEIREQLATVQGRVGRLEDRELASFDYIHQLRAHIDQRRDPPPPPWPDALRHRR